MAAPRRNRVLPTGEIVALAARGTMMGNRGILVDASGRMTNRRWAHKAWICCTRDWKGRRRPIAQPGTWTELFFLDEAVAMAAGHRPCAYCRRPAYRAFLAAWAAAFDGHAKAVEIDAILHAERLEGGAQRRDPAALEDLPDGAFCLWRDLPHLVLGPTLRPFSPEGYGAPHPRPDDADVLTLTPPALRACLANGYAPVLHPSAHD